MTTKLKEIVFTKSDNEYQAIGIYVNNAGALYYGEDNEPVTQVLERGESFYQVRTAAKKLAYANNVTFADLVSTPLSLELAKMRRA